MVANRKDHMTETEYLAFERESDVKHEYINGEIYAMSGGTENHSVIGIYTGAALINKLGDRCRVYSSDMQVQVLETGAFFYPDVSVVCGERMFKDENRRSLLNPTVIIEVLSESTKDYDRGTKFSHYRQLASLQEYILIAQDQAQIDAYLRQDNGNWLLRIITGLDASIELPSLGITLALADIYSRVDFSIPDA